MAARGVRSSCEASAVKASLLLEGALQSPQQPVKGRGEVGELVAARDGQTLRQILRLDAARRLRDVPNRAQRAARQKRAACPRHEQAERDKGQQRARELPDGPFHLGERAGGLKHAVDAPLFVVQRERQHAHPLLLSSVAAATVTVEKTCWPCRADRGT
jgi:hypothetical protein